MSAPAMQIAAAASGAGKTTLTAGLLRAMARRGLRVSGAKSGPDYIDLAFHRAATGTPSVNLDSFAMPPRLLAALVADVAGETDYLVVEGAMGLFDGIPGPSAGRSGMAADLAARFGLPVVIVLDVTGQSQTAAAVVRGLATHDPAVGVAGVILNRVASDRHRSYVADAIERVGFPVFGALPRNDAHKLPSRHLGLVQATEHAGLEAWLDGLADSVEQNVDIDRLLAAFAPVAATPSANAPALPPPGQRIALAADAAFSFMYEHLAAGWRKAGAEIVPFSPLADEPPPAGCDACWLPGGYPELHAGRLAAASRFRDGLVRFASNRPVHGECGGFMVLGTAIEDADGIRHAMTGLLGHATSFARRKMTLGYRSARLLEASAIGRPGDTVLGHEFHYSTVLEAGADAPLVELSDGQGRALGPSGGRRGAVTGAYFHAIAQA